ncbi:hypothetical protein TBS_24760 [Thermobispora bispora]|jgi:hypothetical protein|uniref:Uncharacterized protein n=1 Tax=Thermobispora bispora (strain ATCC 19993 / DSM 43833 / CBS 139.67 / JCM 10125 / KCTC 9307 / NBRC 14880 / R51) TaxID=469371 RepID=D6Y6D7_THEBD|nr:hypothetical protein [Thermobispora bispora]MBO2472849.1 hypothetical protein [Actinomycetales bacterium]MDI9581461.1 hypothetical protein [Thermobispora sp.]ADG87509.1 hypothetical protein Tbis_0785 [Thermobispora bispora DSM 43833]MBX6166885.1 hypothetical protein [Thermobispora bispora]QSI47442.1 hypothetical protein CYL17_05865 [Thermobispora bispora]
MRVYLPCTLPALAEVLKAGELGPAPLTGYAVTPALIEWYASGDTEELEYVAMTEAARASLRLLAAAGPGVVARRVVIAAEVPEEAVAAGTDPAERGRVEVRKPVPLRKIASVHVDDPAAIPDIEAAIAALPGADAGDEDARFVVDGAEDHELMWYARQEIRDLLA